MSYKIPDEILLLWKERERHAIEMAGNADFYRWHDAEADMNELANAQMSKAWSDMVGHDYEIEQIETARSLQNAEE